MGVRMFQGPCSPHSRRIDSVRPATEPPNLTLSITGSTQESMVHCTHRHTIPLSVCRTMPRFLGRFSALLFVSVDPCSTNKRRWNAHRILGFLGVAHVCHKSKWSYQSRAQSFIYCEAWRYNRSRPPSLCGNTITWCIKLFFFFPSLRVTPGPTHSQHLTLSKRHPGALTSAYDIQCNATPHPRAMVSPIHRRQGSDTVLSQKVLLWRGCNCPHPPHPFFKFLPL